MSPTIYDSSLLTQRRQAKIQSGAYLTRMQQNQTSYAPLLGIYDQSMMNSIRTGTIRFFTKNEVGQTLVSSGCPCPPVSVSGTLENGM